MQRLCILGRYGAIEIVLGDYYYFSLKLCIFGHFSDRLQVRGLPPPPCSPRTATPLHVRAIWSYYTCCIWCHPTQVSASRLNQAGR